MTTYRGAEHGLVVPVPTQPPGSVAIGCDQGHEQVVAR